MRGNCGPIRTGGLSEEVGNRDQDEFGPGPSLVGGYFAVCLEFPIRRILSGSECKTELGKEQESEKY